MKLIIQNLIVLSYLICLLIINLLDIKKIRELEKCREKSSASSLMAISLTNKCFKNINQLSILKLSKIEFSRSKAPI